MIILCPETECSADTLEHITQKTGVCSLTAPAADLFIVEDAVYCDAVLQPGFQEAQEGAVAALQIVQPGRREKLLLWTPEARRLSDTELEVRPENAVRCGTKS